MPAGVFARFLAILTVSELILFEEGRSRKILWSDLSLAMSSTVSMRPIFDLGPRCAEGACANSRGLRLQLFARLGHARAARARAYIIFNVLIN